MKLLSWVFVFTVFAPALVSAQNDSVHLNLELTPDEESRLNHFMLVIDDAFRDRQSRPARAPLGALKAADDVITPSSSFPADQSFPTPANENPWEPNYDEFSPFPTTMRYGSSEKIALEVLFQTLNFYGVAHIVEKKSAQVNFQVIKSQYGYFMNLTKLDIAYAIREFSRFFTAHLCGQATMQNFYKAFAQVPAEEIGLRFKYDMAWALLGNSLPKEPNQVQSLGTRWKALQQILSTTTILKSGSSLPADGDGPSAATKYRELRSWAGSISDVVNILGRLNKLMCFVDIRPNPKEELKKRVVVGKILEMDRKLTQKYTEYKELLDQVQKEARGSLLDSLRQPVGTKTNAPKQTVPAESSPTAPVAAEVPFPEPELPAIPKK